MLREHRGVAWSIVKRIECKGALRSLDLEGNNGAGWWDLKLTRRVAESLWLAGRLAIRERRSFQRSFDLVERVIPAEIRSRRMSTQGRLDVLSTHFESTQPTARDRHALGRALERFSASVALPLCGPARIP